MKLTTYTLFILMFSFSYSQENVLLIDSVNRNIIPYANIYFPKSQKGIYSNKSGFFQINKMQPDSIHISCLGYKTLKTTTNLIQDTIFLTPEYIKLNEIQLSTKKGNYKEIGFKKGNNYWYAGRHIELGVILKPNQKNKNSIIKELIIPVSKKKPQSNKNNVTFNSVIKVGIFSIKDNLPNQNLLEKNILINFNQDSDDTIKVDLLNQEIYFTSDGLFINIVIVGEIDDKGNVILKDFPLPAIVCTTKTTKDFSYAQAFYKYKFLSNWNYLTYDKLNFDRPVFPAFRIVVSKYEN